jgi:hypothetical protein
MKNGNIGFAVTMRSCGCDSGRIEEEVGTAVRAPRGTLKFVVPLTAQLFYDTQMVESSKVIEALKEQGYTVSVDRLQFGISMRPLFSQQIWKSKVDRLTKELRGVMCASIDFGKCLITVDYMPAVIRPNEIRNALLGRKRPHEAGNRELRQEESIDRGRHQLKPDRTSGGNVARLSFVETGALQPCRCKDLDGVAA